MPPTRFDPQALIALARGELRGLARRLDVDPAIMCRPWTANQADRYAIRAGWHPIEVWGDAWTDVDPSDDELADDDDELTAEQLARALADLGVLRARRAGAMPAASVPPPR